MKITDIRFETVWLKQAESLVIAYGEMDVTPAIFVKITTDEGICGFGEAAPFKPVTGEDEKTVTAALVAFREALTGTDPLDIAGAHITMERCSSGDPGAKCAVDIALYDIASKASGLPLYRYLGGKSNKIVTDVTIGIDEPSAMAAKAKSWADKGFRILKVKTGRDAQSDLEAIRLIREAVGEDILIRIDGNQGYDPDNCIALLPEFKRFGIKAIEQPVDKMDIEGLARVRRASGSIQIMADESVHGPDDAARLCSAGAVDVMNIKLMKCGGIHEALKINSTAEAHGVSCMVGCMAETELAISAALALVAAKDNITEADCDSFLLLQKPGITMKGGFIYNGSDIILTETPGLGIEIDM